jgi:hypothetical protein
MTDLNTTTNVTTASTYCYGTNDQLMWEQSETGTGPYSTLSPTYDADGNTNEMSSGSSTPTLVR